LKREGIEMDPGTVKNPKNKNTQGGTIRRRSRLEPAGGEETGKKKNRMIGGCGGLGGVLQERGAKMSANCRRGVGIREVVR